MANICRLCIIIAENIRSTRELLSRYHNLAQLAEDNLLNYIINNELNVLNSLIIAEFRTQLEEILDMIQVFHDEIDHYISLHQTHIQRMH